MNATDLNHYISNISIDCVIFGYRDHQLKVLLGKSIFGEHLYNLPGGHIRKNESIESAAERLVYERTQLKKLHLFQFKVFGDSKRISNSPHKNTIVNSLKDHYPPSVIDWITDRFISIGFYALVDISKVKPVTGALDSSLEWRSIHDLPNLMHDHHQIVNDAVESLRQNFDSKLNAFNLLPQTFTMKDLKLLYEAVYERDFPMNNFQKKILSLNVLERLEKKYTGAPNKAPYLYQFKV